MVGPGGGLLGVGRVNLGNFYVPQESYCKNEAECLIWESSAWKGLVKAKERLRPPQGNAVDPRSQGQGLCLWEGRRGMVRHDKVRTRDGQKLTLSSESFMQNVSMM